MTRRRTTLKQRAAAIAAQMTLKPRPLVYQDRVLLSEIDKAIAAHQHDVLAALDRLREAAGLPQDPRVASELNVAQCVDQIFSRPKKVAAA